MLNTQGFGIQVASLHLQSSDWWRQTERPSTVEMNGATSDADKATEQNGNWAGQYLLWGWWGVFTKRGNDMLLKSGSMFHVAVGDTQTVPVVTYDTLPAMLNPALVTIKPTLAAQEYP